jgi:hypothetical protein
MLNDKNHANSAINKFKLSIEFLKKLISQLKNEELEPRIINKYTAKK